MIRWKRLPRKCELGLKVGGKIVDNIYIMGGPRKRGPLERISCVGKDQVRVVSINCASDMVRGP